jgi:uncharacterized membrane protein YqaE (UPF0057 family)
MLYIFAVIFSPLAVLLTGRIGAALLNLVLWFFLIIPGMIHAILVVSDHNKKKGNTSNLPRNISLGVVGVYTLGVIALFGSFANMDEETIAQIKEENAAAEQRAAELRITPEQRMNREINDIIKTSDNWDDLSYFEQVQYVYTRLSESEQKNEDNPITKKWRGWECSTTEYNRSWSVNEYVKRNLNNPRSFKFSEGVTTGLLEDGTYFYMMEYYAENGFGATIKNLFQGRLDSECNIIEVIQFS